jgi:hypothetical protein
MARLLTRETFISSDYVKIAATQSTMFKVTADGEGVEEVPIPQQQQFCSYSNQAML